MDNQISDMVNEGSPVAEVTDNSAYYDSPLSPVAPTGYHAKVHDALHNGIAMSSAPNPYATVSAEELAQQLERANVAPFEVTSEPTDFELLNRRIDDLQQQLLGSHAETQKALQYLCNSMGWLVNMLSGVAQIAQNMPGMGGMMAKMLGGGKK